MTGSVQGGGWGGSGGGGGEVKSREAALRERAQKLTIIYGQVVRTAADDTRGAFLHSTDPVTK